MRSLILIILLYLAGSSMALAQPVVVASIRPLQLIAAAITEGVSETLLVMDSSQDPHHPSLKPSQRRAMNQADIFIWVGPQLETGMEQIVTQLNATVLAALETPDLRVYQVNNNPDPHIWLDTDNVRNIASSLTMALIEIDRENENQYGVNLTRFHQQLDVLDHEISNILQAPGFPPFAVYHNAYQYFEKQFALSHRTSFTNNEEVQPGIRQVLAIKSLLDSDNVNCIVVDPSVNTENLGNQLERSNLRFISVDVLAHDIPLASDAYFRFMNNMATNFASCHH
ncbi:MAG: zinc transport system substrate-binding protein [Pseudohongiellaceae bacterium]|jgi:zinc transport system substrate-binding protein